MLKHVKVENLNDYFVELNSRKTRGVYFYRINGFSEEIKDFILKYHESARKNGVIIEGRIQNPTEDNLSFYYEQMGDSFQLSVGFIMTSLKKWLPRMNTYQLDSVAKSIYDTLELLHRSGKNENMLKNAYTKFMCWLYFKFERIVSQLGENKIPKILYEGTISKYELMLISILSNAGCDVVLLQYQGDAGYMKIDSKSEFSDEFSKPGLQKFPSDFSLKKIRELIQEKIKMERLYGQKASLKRCTNAWLEGDIFRDIRREASQRGLDNTFFYNCFCRVNGTEDKVGYPKKLYQLQLDLKNDKRKVAIVNREIKEPTFEEISAVKRSNYKSIDQMIVHLMGNIEYNANIELQRIMQNAFVDTILEFVKENKGININRLTNKAVFLICWLNRYKPQLFSNWNASQIGCFILLGRCKDEDDSLFLKFLSRLPVDVLILHPNLEEETFLKDRWLYEVNHPESSDLREYPESNSQIKIGTTAYHAEKELDTLLYQDSGLYRAQQYKKANIINLQTMYEEIKILWDEDLVYRPNFSTDNNVVNVPVIFAKVSGVKNGNAIQYWDSIRQLVVEDSIVIDKIPYINRYTENPMKRYTPEFYKNGKLQKKKIKTHPEYPYGILRDEMQDIIIDKLETIIDQRMIKGIGENGTEYTAIAVALNIPTEIIRLIQKFDFTKKNPKLIYINTDESVISLEDSILITLLNLIGFDIVFFVPTGYKSVEKYFTKQIMEEHKIGEYLYDLKIPDFKNNLIINGLNWRDKIFKRGK